MANPFSPDVEADIHAALKELKDPVRLVYFTQEHACGACREQHDLLEALAALSDKIALEIHDFLADDALARQYGIDKVPATAVLADDDHGIRFYGTTGGYEFASLIEAIRMVSTGASGLDSRVEAVARTIAGPVHLEIMVTLTCPYCPRMVRLAHQLAFVNPAIRADMVEASAFPVLVKRYGVGGVPQTVVNERPAFEGALPAPSALLEIVKAAEPSAYAAAADALGAAQETRKAVRAEPGEPFDILVVGAGPAALSAALYGARKDRRVALIGEKPGGQVNDTARVENYLGLTAIGGPELAERFQAHVEAYPVAERLNAAVAEIGRDGPLFRAVLRDGTIYRARTVIYAAGKQYRHLGVPGEDRFVGHGISFCATCDAPLFRGKTVAVVGGGNSAFTAVRDLVRFAKHIHVVHMLEAFQADPVLVDEVKQAPNVTFHMKAEVRAFLGDAHLTGIRIAGAGERFDLLVDGVFLEIGLVPNSDPVGTLVTLNDAGEIPVGRSQHTAIPGLFAAGDVTDEPEKQIIIAAGAGARAALAADAFLSEHASSGAASVAAT